MTKKWPVLDAVGPPSLDLGDWTLSMKGLVANPIQWDWKAFSELARVKVVSDFHCVTRWSRLDNTWEGVSTRELVKLAGNLARREICARPRVR